MNLKFDICDRNMLSVVISMAEVGSWFAGEGYL
jgi:hypothetical protein